jgi:hypothetical protein
MLQEQVHGVRGEKEEAAAAAAELTPDQQKRRKAAAEATAKTLRADGYFLEADAAEEAAGLVAGGDLRRKNDQHVASHRIPVTRSVADESAAYIRVPAAPIGTNAIGWWREHRSEFPTLARVAARVLIVPATSVPVERLFSKVKHLVPPQRSSLSGDRIDQMVMISENIDLYPSAICAYRHERNAPSGAAAAV